MTLQEETLGAGRGGGFSPAAPDREVEYAALQMLGTHGQREGEAIAAYERMAEESSAGDGIKYLIRLIIDDERRHHRVFEEMANELKSFVWEVDVEPRVPNAMAHRDPALLKQTKALLALEKDDEKELRHLLKVLRHGPKSSLHPVLIKSMLHDTAKHIAILEFIRDRLSSR